MILFGSVAAGVIFGLAYFAGLWFTVRRVAYGAWGFAPLMAGTAARVALAGGVFFAVSRLGAGPALAALAGFLGSRWLLTAVCAWGAGTRGETTRSIENGT